MESERVVVAKPIASRPTSSFKSFSDLLAGAFYDSSHTKSSEAAVPAIRPKTVRLSSMINRATPKFSYSQAEISETTPSNMSNKIPQSHSKEFVLHKPLAKLVSRTTISLLANMDNLSISQQQPQGPIEACVKHSSQDKCILRNQPSSYSQQSITSHKTSNQVAMPYDMATQSSVEKVKLLPSSHSDRPSYDGYNWRKYGQKQVKGSEYPRSYYKCTRTCCPVKKKVERSFDGQIAEIVYKGEHNHSKPQPPTTNSSATDRAGPGSGGVDQETNHLLLSNHLCQKNDRSEGREENRNENAPFFKCSYQYKDPMQYDSLPALSSIAGAETSGNTCGLNGEYEEGNNKSDTVEDEPESKRRKSKNQLSEVRPSNDALLEASAVMQNYADSELLEDGFRWRKYGQKLVKGNSYPRSYYRCTYSKCSARKHVERSADDPQAFLTTYEGKHSHEMPFRSQDTAASGSAQGTGKGKP